MTVEEPRQMYNVHVKRVTSSQLRLRLADVLDSAERGEAVIIERRGARFLLRAEGKSPPRRKRRKIFDVVDPAVADGQWTWSWQARSLTFSGRSRRR